MPEPSDHTVDQQAEPSRLLRPGRNCWRAARADEVAFLIDGQAYFDALVAALEAAEERVLITGWDIDSRVVLARSPGRKPDPDKRLGPLLERLVDAKPGLQVHILSWDWSLLFARDRELLTSVRLGLTSHRRIHFRSDGEHPLGASHHQKIVVVDDRLAFAGGFDLTHERWDTPDHRADEPARTDPNGEPYLPFHDAAMAVSGESARALAELVRDRWERAGGDPIPPVEGDARPWPKGLEPDARDARVGIARTQPAYKDLEEVREVEALYVDAIEAAERWIYLENQYLTSEAICSALKVSLSKAEGPEILLVLPRKSQGWLEEQTMNALRVHRLADLRRADENGRLRTVYPRLPGLDQGWLNVHAKLMLVDDRLARIGSANLSNRSMGLDTECDLAMEAGQEPAHRRAVEGLRDKLLAEHLGVDPEQIESTLADTGSLLAAVEALSGGERTLLDLESLEHPLDGLVLDRADLVDPEQPAELDRLLDRIDPQAARRSTLGSLLLLGLVMAGLLGLAAAWAWTPLGERLDPTWLAQQADRIEQLPWLLLALLGAYLAGALVVFPISVLFAVTGLLLAPLPALGIAWVGCLASASLSYVLGRWLGQRSLPAFLKTRLDSLKRRLAKRGVLAVALLRLVPTAPYPMINFAAGTVGVRFSDCLLGTGLGMLPGIVLIVLSADLIRELLAGPDPLVVAGLAAVLVAAVVFVIVLRRRLTSKRRTQAGAS